MQIVMQGNNAGCHAEHYCKMLCKILIPGVIQNVMYDIITKYYAKF